MYYICYTLVNPKNIIMTAVNEISTKHRLNEEVTNFLDFRDPESDIRCLDLMFQQFTCSPEVFFQEDRASAWLLYSSLRDLLIVMKEEENMKGGGDE